MTLGALLGPSVLPTYLVGGLLPLAAILALLMSSLGNLVGPPLTLIHCAASMTTGPLDPLHGNFSRDLSPRGWDGGGPLLETRHNQPALYPSSPIDDPRGWLLILRALSPRGCDGCLLDGGGFVLAPSSHVGLTPPVLRSS